MTIYPWEYVCYIIVEVLYPRFDQFEQLGQIEQLGQNDQFILAKLHHKNQVSFVMISTVNQFWDKRFILPLDIQNYPKIKH